MGKIAGSTRRRATLAAVAGIVALLSASGTVQAESNCHKAPDAKDCVWIGPHPLPLSVPEFNRLSAKVQSQPETAATLILLAMLMADEMPKMASEVLALRISDTRKAEQAVAQKFMADRNDLAAKCAATFVIGTKPPDYRINSNAIAFSVRRETKAPSQTRSVTLCSTALGCVALSLENDSDRGWQAISVSPLLNACGRLKK